MPPAPIRIADASDPRVEPYRNIRDRDLAGRDGLFIAEGKVVLRVLVDAGRFDILSLLVLENRLAGLKDALERLPADVPVYVADAGTLGEIAGFDMHRGVLALGRRRKTDDAAALIGGPAPKVALGLVGISNHDNMGALFRNAAAFGAGAVLMDGTSCDPLYRKAIRVSVGAALKVPYARLPDAAALCSAFEANGYTLYALTPRGSTDIATLDPAPRSALLLGTEGEGLPAAVIERAVGLRIDIASGFDSLNVATAAAVALHHFRQKLLSQERP
jgi:tRNA G18 (ribose-2'-O)-methylase SpoU